MIAALAYLQYHSVKNRLVQRFTRLRQPKYLIGAIVGAAYFYFYIFRFLFAPRTRAGAATPTALPMDPLLWESIAALILFGVVFLAWLIPRERAALAFSEAEVAFLFPAPISRRGLIHFKLLRQQLGLILTVLFFTLLSTSIGRSGHGLFRAIGWWVILFTLNLHFMGASFALTLLMDRGLANWKRRVALLGLLLVAAGVVIAWAVKALPELRMADLTDTNALVDYLKQALVSGPLPYLLYPFRLVVRPYFATDWLALGLALGPALLLLALHYVWVVRADVAFEEASVEASRRMAEKIAAARAGNLQSSGGKLKSRRDPFHLRPGGAAAVALLWKNLISAGNVFNLRMAVLLLVVVASIAIALRGTATNINWVGVLGIFACAATGWMLLVGPQILRQDLRQDLPNADLLKSFPLRGWQVVAGEILAPAVILTVIHWLLILMAAVCVGALAQGQLSGTLLLAIGFGAALVLPGFNLISLLIPNAAVLLFPAWFQAGRQGPAGLEATGQRLIFAIGQFLAFALSLIPAGIGFLIVFLLVRLVLGDAVAVALGAVVAAVALAAEVALGVLLLGRCFERFDLSAEPPA